MFAYCNNNPVKYIDSSGYILRSFLDDTGDVNLVHEDVAGGGGFGVHHYRADLSIASRSSSWSSGILSSGYAFWEQTLPLLGSGGRATELTRVGRWMSRTEYEQMVATNRVQMSPNGNTTYVANPANKSAYEKQASPGSYYVEFSVPSNTIYPAGNPGWGQIAGPGSLYDRLDRYKGGNGITIMPIAYDIKIEGEK